LFGILKPGLGEEARGRKAEGGEGGGRSEAGGPKMNQRMFLGAKASRVPPSAENCSFPLGLVAKRRGDARFATTVGQTHSTFFFGCLLFFGKNNGNGMKRMTSAGCDADPDLFTIVTKTRFG
jgi:hypothetical protein